MNHVHFDASSGMSGDMVLGALLDLGVEPDRFVRAMGKLRLPVRIAVREVRRSHLRALKVDVVVDRKRTVERTLGDIERIVAAAPFPAGVRERARKIFRRLFEAEAKVHGRPLRSVHLHEAGADDALVDVLGTCWLADALEVGTFSCSPLNVGSGTVKTSHGLLPVPPPAVSELLKGVPVYSAGAEVELVTPTGAAIASTLAASFVRFPEIVYGRVGCGAGSREIPGLPNILRAFCGEASLFRPDKGVHVIETTIDDSTPQVLARFVDRAFELGALDAHLTPIVMKKGRLATKLTILATADRMDDLVRAVFRETSSIGLRSYPVERRVLEREVRKVAVRGKEIAVKVSRMDGEAVTVQPEYEDCLRVAASARLPLKEVMRLALEAYEAGTRRRTAKES